MEYAEGFSIYILQQTSAKTWMASISVRSDVRSVSGGRGVWPKECRDQVLANITNSLDEHPPPLLL